MLQGKPQYWSSFNTPLNFLMKLCVTNLFCCALFLIITLLPQSLADLNSDRQVLLSFATSMPHGKKLNWSPTFPICTSWIGINCSADGASVIGLHLPGIGLTGPIPTNTLGNLTNLTVLSLRSNWLNGTLPLDILSLPSLHYLFLQDNNISGELPTSLPPQLTALDLSFNSLTGSIPLSLQNLTQLTVLNLQHNLLSGPLPDFSLSRLQRLNLSNNHFNGTIPSSLQRFPDSSFIGNSLCGPPLIPCSVLPPQRRSSRRRIMLGAIIAIAVGCAFLLFLLGLCLLFCVFWKKESGESNNVTILKSSEKQAKEEFESEVQELEKNKLVFFEGCIYDIDLEDLLIASAEVLGKGCFGTVYKAVLEESTTVVVKRLKDVIVTKKDFEQQMEVIGQVLQHPNIVPLRAYYYSKDEKLLVYDYYPNGSLASLLHGKTADKPPLNWESRLKISIGASKAIAHAHLHSTGGTKFVHGNIESSNILLNQDLESCVSDFGLAPVMNIPTISPRHAGYRAPEMIGARKYTHKSDVYSFGVVLLEMLTGKQPGQSSNREEVTDLPRWVQCVVREEWTAEVFDVELMRFQNIEEEMLQMLQIAMACVVKEQDSRPDMAEVVRMIEEVRQCDSVNRPS